MSSATTTILIVDDAPTHLKLLQEMLLEWGYRVVAFPRSDLGLKAAVKHPPDMFLLDIRMPDTDGTELCGQLKTYDQLREIPVIFISALNDAEDKVRAFAAGGVDYITKPFQPEEVRVRLMNHLRLHSLQQQLTRYNQNLEELVQAKVQEVTNSKLATIYALSELVESRDLEIGGHIARTQAYVRALAEQLQRKGPYTATITADFLENITQASPLHDIGKVGIPDRILLKSGKLTAAEFEAMKRHTIIGEQPLRKAFEQYPNNGFLEMGMQIARSHHEKWDGSGYPDGLSGTAIPLCARIMALADVYDALRSNRPYKAAFSHAQSTRIIYQDAGSHFDPSVVEAFAALEKRFAAINDSTEAPLDETPTSF